MLQINLTSIDIYNRMIYFAIAMVFAGLLCFVYVSLGQAGKLNPENSRMRNRSQNNVTSLDKKLFNVKYSERKNPFIEERVRSERNFRNEVSRTTISEEVTNSPESVSNESNREENTNVSVAKESSIDTDLVEVEFNLEATLYVDYSKQIRYESKLLKEKNWNPEVFHDFRRIGPGLLSEERDEFLFKSENVRYSYNVSELDQIVFYDGAFALIPSDPALPIPVFFSTGSESFREFLSMKS
ncbi:MAG: hypothetical protein K8R21_09225 [Leptospira sp.]|nr:hypothetical protein [Leptospira sp.]